MILNKKYNIKVIAIFIFCCFSYGQSLSSDNYKTTLRMKLEIDKKPALYLDEPLSADLEKIHKACKVYIYLHERKSDSEMIQHSGNEIKMSVEKMKKKVNKALYIILYIPLNFESPYLSRYVPPTVFHAEFESAVKNSQILEPGSKT